ncbi:putative lipid II flippase FtsW [Paraliobacillus quinghaiensis]|uniref:Probable peptidoglycan glycosyltransferase FtsW n=1 Tax=Paraliobacillus quinghaiensis TaxID=470815 RepID=A0A917WPZ4_9BACI|nr:putative lipid II flippase FtsW [Paraliobacillus quinghaiensis]GGM20380.1 putative lipid II flippase FtsW [Paraliobacillus quinghaiensis]
MKNKLKTFDFILVFTPLILTIFGIVMIYSSSMVIAVMDKKPPDYYMMKQIQWFIIGLVLFIFCCFFNYRHYQKLMKFIIFGLIIMLVMVLFEEPIKGARSWLSVGSYSIQPSEFVKIGLIMYLASVYSKKQSYLDHFSSGVLPPLIMTGILLGLIFFQPDIGTAAIIFLIACSVIFSSGIKFKHLSILILAGAVFLIVAGAHIFTSERLSRFTGAYQPFTDPEDGGYQLIQSYIAIGTGGLDGLGLGQSVQKLGYLTEGYNDFIMAVIAEELGFIGVVIVIGLLALIVLRGLYMAKICQDSFGSLLAIGISSMVGVQAFINLGAISGLLPITGVTLPFVSYGGSSLLVLMISMGILNNVARHAKRATIDPASEKDYQPNFDENKFGSVGTRFN